MNLKEAAAILDGRQYRNEITREEEALFKLHGICAVFGASDDLMEFCGAIQDEFGCYNGGTAALLGGEIAVSECDEGPECPYFQEKLKSAQKIQAVWDADPGPGPGPCWTYKTDIHREKFMIYEDGEPYCEGFVFQVRATPSQVRELAELTGCGIMECQAALEACGADMRKAQEYLKRK